MSDAPQQTNASRRPLGVPQGGPMMMGSRGGGPVEKAKDFKGTMKQLGAYLRPYWAKILMVITFAIISTIFAIASPKILGQATNQIVDDYISVSAYDQIIKSLPSNIKELPAGATGADLIKKMPTKEISKIPSSKLNLIKSLDLSKRPIFHFDKIWNIILLLLFLYAISASFSYIQGWVMSGIAQKIAYQFRKDISKKINRLPLSYFDKRTYGEVLSRVTNDVDTVGQTLNQSLSQIVTSVIMIIGITIMMFSISWLLAIVAIIILPISFILIAQIMKRSQVQFAKQQSQLGAINGHIEEMYAGHAVMRVFNGEKKSVHKFETINTRLYHSAWKAQFLSGIMMPLMTFVGNLGYVGVSIIGGWLAINGKIRIGDIQAFIQYVQQFNQPITQTANIANVMQSTAAAAERVFQFLEEPEDNKDEGENILTDEVRGEVEFDNVVFGYEPGKEVIKGLSIKIKPGQRVAIVGPTGAGKTTLVNLLMRFYDVDSGSIKVDGIDILDIKRSSVRKLFGMVLQDTWLFNGTIRDNIIYGKPNVTESEMIEVAKYSYVDHFIHSLPHGYDMILNEEVNNISQGEKQLLTIARAMLVGAPMLILDEATSSVDTRTELLIQNAMDVLMEGKTSFVIAHRLSTIKNADLILVMKDGNVIEQGDHKTLLAKNGFYADLYNSQFIGE